MFSATSSTSARHDATQPGHCPARTPSALKLYFVNIDFPPVGGPGVWRTLAFAKYAALAGHGVKVFTSDRSSWHTRSDPALLAQLPVGVEVRRISSVFLSDIRRNMEARIAQARNGRFKRLLEGLDWRIRGYWPDNAIHWALKCALAVWRSARRERPDAVFTTGPSHLSHLAGFLASRLLGIRWVMDYRDPWIEQRGHQIIQGPYQQVLFERLERRFLKQADAVVSVSPSWLEMLKAKVPDQGAKFHLIRNGQDLDESVLSPPLGCSDSSARPLWLHFNGTIQPNNNLIGNLREALALLRAAGYMPADLRISFSGLPAGALDGEDPQDTAAFLQDLGAMPLAVSLATCQQADCLLLPIRDQGLISLGAIPAKTYEAMALGKHILGLVPDPCDARALLEDYPLSHLSRSLSPEGIAEVLTELIEHFRAAGHALPPLAAEAHRQVFQRYSRRDQAAQLLALFAALADASLPAPAGSAC
jgi:glycosyltransferase involved in cell wall biosynthesis